MGPLVTREHRDRVRGYVDLGVEEGAKLVVDGRGLNVAGHEQGYLPRAVSVRSRAAADAHLSRGDLRAGALRACACRISPSALDARQSTTNSATARRSSRRAARRRARLRQAVQAGMVGVNVPIPVPMAFHSFGGWKRSLFGPLHVHGPDGVRFYTRLKTVTSRWPTTRSRSRAVRDADDEVVACPPGGHTRDGRSALGTAQRGDGVAIDVDVVRRPAAAARRPAT